MFVIKFSIEKQIKTFWTAGFFLNFFQNGTFEPMHEIWFFWTKSILLKDYENGNKKNVLNMSQGLPHPGLMQEKV